MLYIFDLGNVVIDIDFNRVLGVWSTLSGAPLATLRERFVMGPTFQQHERGEISDETFASQLCHEMGITLSYEQFAMGWQAIFIGLRREVVDIMHRLRHDGHRVVILSNTNRLHCEFWPTEYPEVVAAADRMYLSQDLGLRKPEADIYRHVLREEGVGASEVLFFDDNEANVVAAQALGIQAVQVHDRQVVPDFFARQE
ncbi:glucose-1-phosphatase [Musicola paradisiaca]|uniref:HAD-superfamily hydrolase, subfamily IA, variant 3 n=1 Tax=Musicola paradisiaca (strain Ech703) TaxID=579405 RepID=C6C6A1_MUSP7|nr:glucose-1-phosphatase [Musicola paradisiaca]ACS87710.1 HAD-superfamily hydrolase, subfamily IA, variant 3 [Musicola paradisiaca Ech703]